MTQSTLPILEPLSEATKQELTPLRLGSHDYLEIWMDEKNSNFEMRPISCRPLRSGDEVVVDAKNIKTTVTGDKVVPYGSRPSWEARQFFKRIPESRFIGAKDFARPDDWWIGGTDYSVIVIHHSWPRDRIIFRGQTSHVFYHFLLRRFLSQTARANLQAKFKLNGETPEMPEDFEEHPNPDLRLADYQKVALVMGLGQEATGLYMDRGTGKTPTTIARICLEAKRTRQGKMGDPRMMRVLVVCPNQVRKNWQKEFSRFATTPGKITIIRGGQFYRIKLLTEAMKDEPDCAFSVCIIGYDTLPRDVEFFEKVPWDLIVTDESHYFKSQGTKRFKTLKRLREFSGRRMELTGTPIGNSIMDLYSQLEFLGEGLSGFSSFKNFISFHGKFKKDMVASDNGRFKLEGVQNIPLMQERLSRLTFSISREDAGLKLPPKVPLTFEVNMTPKQFDFYRKLATQLAIEIKSDMEKGQDKTLTAEHILTKLLRLQQICSGFITWDEIQDPDTGEVIQQRKTEQIDSQNPKINELISYYFDPQRDPNSKMVIWCCFVEDIRAISQRLSIEGIRHATYYGATSDADREYAEEAFNKDPDLKVLIANPQTAGEGLNLHGYDIENPDGPTKDTYAGDVIFYSMNWSYIQWAQAQDRAHRRGTKMPVNIIDLMVPGSIDEEIRDRVRTKEHNALTIQDIQQILENVLDFEALGD